MFRLTSVFIIALLAAPGKALVEHLIEDAPFEIVQLQWRKECTSLHLFSLQNAAPATAFPTTSSFSFAFDEKHYGVTVERNDALFSSNYTQVRRHADGSTTEVPSAPNCHYVGSVEGQHRSNVAFSTCDGRVNGIVQAHGENLVIQPLRTQHETTSARRLLANINGDSASSDPLYLIYRLADSQDAQIGRCPVGEEGHEGHDEHSQAAHDFLESSLFSNDGLDLSDTHSGRELLQSTTKYVELLVANDWQRMQQAGPNGPEVDTSSIVNIVTSLYKGATWGFPNVQIVLVHQTSWDHDAMGFGEPTTIGINVDTVLRKWNTMRRTPLQLPDHDNGELFSGYKFQSSVVGYAAVSAMCSASHSSGIVTTKSFSSAYVASVVAHEMGHNFGLLHDGTVNGVKLNNCPSSGYIMAASACSNCIPSTQFSTCSGDYIKKFFEDYSVQLVCLDNDPRDSWEIRQGRSYCGNGIIEKGEQCDCGATDCSTIDPCCDGRVCQLTFGSECAGSQECCVECKFATAGTQCRRQEILNGCDVGPEVCDGSSSQCPDDTFKLDGRQCTDSLFLGNGVCHQGGCVSYAQQCSSQVNGPWEPCNGLTHKFVDDCGTLRCRKKGTTECVDMEVPDESGLTTRKVSVAAGMPCATGKTCFHSNCTKVEQTYVWRTGPWSACSRDCAGGVRSREVYCADMAGEPANAETHCFAELKPLGSDQCNTFECNPCDAANCGNHGTCSEALGGQCVCNLGYHGDNCAYPPRFEWVTQPNATYNKQDLLQIEWKFFGNMDRIALVLRPAEGETKLWPTYMTPPPLSHKLTDLSGSDDNDELSAFVWPVPLDVPAGRYVAVLSFSPKTELTSTSFEVLCLDDECGYGTCGASGVCECQPAFSGPQCDIWACDSVQCTNGDCLRGECRCDVGWSGDWCDKKADCPLVCHHGGRALRCTGDQDGACDCSASGGFWEGTMCQTCKVECVNGGVPNAACNGCDCNPGFTGQYCEIRYFLGKVQLAITVDKTQGVFQDTFNEIFASDLGFALGMPKSLVAVDDVAQSGARALVSFRVLVNEQETTVASDRLENMMLERIVNQINNGDSFLWRGEVMRHLEPSYGVVFCDPSVNGVDCLEVEESDVLQKILIYGGIALGVIVLFAVIAACCRAKRKERGGMSSGVQMG